MFKQRSKAGRPMWILGALFTFTIQPVLAQAVDESQVWQAGAGNLSLELRGDYLPDFGIEILSDGRAIDDRRRLDFPVEVSEALSVHAPWGIYESMATDRGRLDARLGLTWRRGSRIMRVDEIQLLPEDQRGHPILIAQDMRGNALFTLSHIHLTLQPERGSMRLANADIEASAHLARELGFPELAGMPIGTASLDLSLDIPEGAELAGTPPNCTERPIWPQEGQFEADVTLIDMSDVAYQGTDAGSGRIKVAPSATLMNESLADVPWVGQFDTIAQYPYSPRDQHPFLVWNMYKIADGRIRMLGASGVKHAFYTINVGAQCQNCGSNYILWPGCEDTYSSQSNDTWTYQGPRSEIEASEGLWHNCNSFFDPNCTGSQTQLAGEWLNRLLVDPSEFQQAGARYFLDAWYVVQHDTNIWNTMGFRELDPTPNGAGWLMNPISAFSQGATMSEWIGENTSESNATHALITVPSATPAAPYPGNLPQGHLRLAVKVTEAGPGRYRYNYALQNFDFDRGLEGFRIDIPVGSEVFETAFFDIDEDAANNWSVTVLDDYVLFEAPQGNELDWFELFNFELEIDALPVTSNVSLDLGADASQPEMGVRTLGPASGTGLLFEDRFRGFEN